MLGELTWCETPQGGLLAVPVGATEQHGAHLPLSTDTDIAVALAVRLAQARPGVAVAPPVAYGASGEHQAFPGTLSIGAEATELLLVELARSASHTFSRVVLVSAHGGNARPVARAVRRLREEGVDVLAWSPRWDGDAHAGQIETAVLLALRPEAVRLSRAVAGDVRPLADLMPTLMAHGVRAVSRNGVLGDPTEASAAAGEELLAEATLDLLRAVG